MTAGTHDALRSQAFEEHTAWRIVLHMFNAWLLVVAVHSTRNSASAADFHVSYIHKYVVCKRIGRWPGSSMPVTVTDGDLTRTWGTIES